MIVYDCWWLLMIVDDCWWLLMIVDDWYCRLFSWLFIDTVRRHHNIIRLGNYSGELKVPAGVNYLKAIGPFLALSVFQQMSPGFPSLKCDRNTGNKLTFPAIFFKYSKTFWFLVKTSTTFSTTVMIGWRHVSRLHSILQKSRTRWVLWRCISPGVTWYSNAGVLCSVVKHTRKTISFIPVSHYVLLS